MINLGVTIMVKFFSGIICVYTKSYVTGLSQAHSSTDISEMLVRLGILLISCLPHSHSYVELGLGEALPHRFTQDLSSTASCS